MCFSCSLELILIRKKAFEAKVIPFYEFCLFAIMQRSYLMGLNTGKPAKIRKGLYCTILLCIKFIHLTLEVCFIMKFSISCLSGVMLVFFRYIYQKIS